MQRRLPGAPLAGLCFAALVLLAGAAAANGPEPIEIGYELPRAAQVSVVIKDQRGRIVRELLHAAERSAGRHTETWDGLNDEGEPVAPGKYRWRLLTTQGVEARYLLTLGTNPKPRWASWPGNHGAVVCVTTDGQGRMFVAGGCGEGTPLIVAQRIASEERLWTVPQWFDAWQGGMSMASAGGSLYMLQQNGKVYRIDAETGSAATIGTSPGRATRS